MIAFFFVAFFFVAFFFIVFFDIVFFDIVFFDSVFFGVVFFDIVFFDMVRPLERGDLRALRASSRRYAGGSSRHRSRPLTRAQRRRIASGDLQPGDVAALRRFVCLTQRQLAQALGNNLIERLWLDLHANVTRNHPHAEIVPLCGDVAPSSITSRRGFPASGP